MGQRLKRNLTISSITLCLVFIVASGFYFQTQEDDRLLGLRVVKVADEEALGVVSSLMVELTNNTLYSVEPEFSIMWNQIPYYWRVVEGPQLLSSQSSANYKLATSIPEAMIPNHTSFIARVNDAHSSVFFPSQPAEVNINSLPAIVNSHFAYWQIDPATKVNKPFGWNIWNDQGKEDMISVSQEAIEGRNSLKISVTQDGVADNQSWAAGHVWQDVEYPAQKVGLWVYPTFSYQGGNSPQSVFGIETHDGNKMLWFIFSDQNEGIYDLPDHRIIVTRAPLNEWSYHEIDILNEYTQLDWQTPRVLRIMAIVGLHQSLPGTGVGYFGQVSLVP